MSAGFKIFLAGHKRFAYPHTTMLYHQMSIFEYGTIHNVSDRVDIFQNMQEEIERYVCSRTNITAERLSEINQTNTDWFIRSEEFELLGICELLGDNVKEFQCVIEE